jgi:hypothetical protein
MIHTDEQWIKKLQEKLDNYTPPTPTDGWERLERELRPRPRVYRWQAWSIAAAIAAIAVSVATYLFSPTTDTPAPTQSVIATVVPPQPIQVAPQPTTPAVETAVVRPTQARARIAQAVVSPVADKQTLEPVSEAVVDEETQPITRDTTTRYQPIERPYRSPLRNRRRTTPATPAKQRSESRGWSMGVHLNSGTYSQIAKNNAPQPFFATGDIFAADGIAELSPSDISVENGELLISTRAGERLKNKHHQPVSVGISIRRQLGERWAVESGLVYTLLESDIADPWQMVSQQLHYLGIPLKTTWSMVNNRRFNLYLSAGALLEKNLYGKLGGEKLAIKSLDFSLNGGVGAQYNFSKLFGVYVEPGIGYYFNTTEVVETIRSERPFTMNLQAGVRFSY